MSVRDTGPGISEEEQNRIFDRFYRGVAARAGGVPARGWVWQTGRDIMAWYAGRLIVHSVVGAGSSFTLWLPLIAVPPSL